MEYSRLNNILNSKQKIDIYYENEPVWIQELNKDTAKIGYIFKPIEKNVNINDLREV